MDNLVKTENFGYVLRRDYDNLRFDFLKRDKGVPYIAKKVEKVVEDCQLDAFGKKKKLKTLKLVVEDRIAPEYLEWEKLVSARKYANQINAVDTFNEKNKEQIQRYSDAYNKF
jgi:hypothetical protein